ncbi:uncharacterized protein EV422DRAFT_563463 [Fimicolochytrium jonesii]|uniref:uncharacterized protein n=1 Tax=Fimicolochytrium jonesii TaxID=1396493 RepID=UPI0022FF11FD|nr:uncharacterized protein EV422DRAFT_563463 [Fimicolochytrium jonesii]KAI8825633.1 hypothetical protein EV422DRAFT_563463 [Fimicolochytrium jonesii]
MPSPTALHPLFVYGTLLTGLPNHALFSLADKVTHVRGAILKRHDMYSLNDWYPVIVEAGGGEEAEAAEVRGEVMYFAEEHYTSILMRLDELESYHGPSSNSNMYIRAEGKVTLTSPPVPLAAAAKLSSLETPQEKEGEEIQVYYYRWNRPLDPQYFKRIESGDWKEHIDAIQRKTSKQQDGIAGTAARRDCGH